MPVLSARSGYVCEMQAEELGIACVVLGGGREKKEDLVDPAVGLVVHKKTGHQVSEGEPLCTIHYNDSARALRAKVRIENSYRIAQSPPTHRRPLIQRVIRSSGEKT
jgi:pyrimidine-nucleoside phosphorylase